MGRRALAQDMEGKAPACATSLTSPLCASSKRAPHAATAAAIRAYSSIQHGSAFNELFAQHEGIGGHGRKKEGRKGAY